MIDGTWRIFVSSVGAPRRNTVTRQDNKDAIIGSHAADLWTPLITPKRLHALPSNCKRSRQRGGSYQAVTKHGINTRSVALLPRHAGALVERSLKPHPGRRCSA